MGKYLRFFVGCIFLLSGTLKAIDATAFADLMSKYGAVWFGYGAPVVIAVEILLGLMFVTNIYPRATAITAAAFILSVSVIYGYGITFRGITDCGCFGPITFLNSRPWVTFVRNGVLLAMLVPSVIQKQDGAIPSVANTICMAIVMIAVMFITGNSFSDAKCLRKRTKQQPIALKDSPLNDYITCHEDSTYLVFAFSYGCPYCQNSIGNICQYTSMGIADTLIGIAVADSVKRERFERLFGSPFSIREVTDYQMYQLTRTLPVAYLVRHDTIIKRYKGMVTSPALYLP